MNDIHALYDLWCEKATADKDLLPELESVKGNEDEILDRFYKNLEFGTAGLRGVIGAGTNRMNVYTVNQATQGLADYLNADFENPSIAIAYDSRIKSDVFARSAAAVLAANGVQVHLYPELVPTPMLSYAVRTLHCSSGIIITASHNPSKYNGYKCYDPNGYQMTDEAAAKTYAYIQKVDMFSGVRTMDFDEAVAAGKITYIGREVFENFYKEVRKAQVNPDAAKGSDLSVIYTPLNGTGNKHVREILKEIGISDVTVVPEQELPDGNFPTCPYPNPEIKEAMALGMECAQRYNADLLLATDPDCDRVGIAVKDKNGEYVLLSGNETGILLLDYVCAQRTKHGKMPADPVMVKTIVTTDMGEQIAAHYGVRTINVLTGFKFIGEQIGLLEKQGKADSYIFGFEESYGYLSGGYVRDKDGVNGATLICEMFSYYATQGVNLLDKLNELYQTYGYCLNTLHSYEFDGSAGFAKMQNIMKTFREEVGPGKRVDAFAGKKIEKVLDYSQDLDGLPKSDVLKYLLEGHCSVVVRPSGTEPKLKVYISVSAEDKEQAETMECTIVNQMKDVMIV